jgi:hypothetical protein
MVLVLPAIDSQCGLITFCNVSDVLLRLTSRSAVHVKRALFIAGVYSTKLAVRRKPLQGVLLGPLLSDATFHDSLLAFASTNKKSLQPCSLALCIDASSGGHMRDEHALFLYRSFYLITRQHIIVSATTKELKREIARG